jgi:hypothetical protein
MYARSGWGRVEIATTESGQVKIEAVNTISDSTVQLRVSEVFDCLNAAFLRAVAQTMGGLGPEVSSGHIGAVFGMIDYVIYKAHAGGVDYSVNLLNDLNSDLHSMADERLVSHSKP